MRSDSVDITMGQELCGLLATGADGKEYNTKFYNLEAVIAVGFRTNSERAIVFRSWASSVLKEFSICGYVLDKERLKNGTFLNEEYFDHLLEDTREIRASERKFYQKITDIYATTMDYSVQAATPWMIYGEGPTRMIKVGPFNEEQKLNYAAKDIRFKMLRGNSLFSKVPN